MRDSFSSIFHVQLGVELEGELTEACRIWFHSKGDESSFVCASGTAIDKFEGTDAIIWGVRTDFTCNFNSKDHMDVLPDSYALPIGVDVKFGVRTGNNYRGGTKFKTPVLVIGLQVTEEFLRNWMNNIIDDFKKAIENILELGQVQFWDWCDAHNVTVTA